MARPYQLKWNSFHRPAGVMALATFFAFGAFMSGTTLMLLLFPGSMLDVVWRLNPRAQEGFHAVGSWSLLLMTTVCMACIAAAMGLWRCKRWGYWTALTILVANLTGDTVNGFIAHDWRTLVGLPIAGLMIWYLYRQRKLFEKQAVLRIGHTPRHG